MDAFLKSLEALVFFVNSTANSPRSFFKARLVIAFLVSQGYVFCIKFMTSIWNLILLTRFTGKL